MDKTGQPSCEKIYYAKKANGKAWSKFLWEDTRNIWSLNYNSISKLNSYIERPGQHLLWEDMRNILVQITIMDVQWKGFGSLAHGLWKECRHPERLMEKICWMANDLWERCINMSGTEYLLNFNSLFISLLSLIVPFVMTVYLLFRRDCPRVWLDLSSFLSVMFLGWGSAISGHGLV